MPMNLFSTAISFILHIDDHLQLLIGEYGFLTYAILFAIVFIETGVVIMPFLPGDSLLFAAGAFAARGSFNVVLLFIVLSAAAILGDTVNYALGRRVGPAVFRENSRFLHKDHLLRAEAFYEKHGKKTIILARFIPIIRTLAPFVAGVGKMEYGTFISYNIIGGFVWVALFTFGGFFFGNIPFVARHFEIVILAIIALSLLPPVLEWVKHAFASSAEVSKK